MVRTQIQLSDAQLRLLKRLATDRGVSVATLIRESVDRFVRSRIVIQDVINARSKVYGGVGALKKTLKCTEVSPDVVPPQSEIDFQAV